MDGTLGVLTICLVKKEEDSSSALAIAVSSSKVNV